MRFVKVNADTIDQWVEAYFSGVEVLLKQ